MLKELSGNRTSSLIPLLLILLVLAGCSTVVGMTKVDKYYQDKGYTLHCTEVAGEECLTHQWFNHTVNTYQRFHDGSNADSER